MYDCMMYLKLSRKQWAVGFKERLDSLEAGDVFVGQLDRVGGLGLGQAGPKRE